MKQGAGRDYKVSLGAVPLLPAERRRLLGLGSDNLITIPAPAQNEISLTHLEATLRDLYQRRNGAAIILTLAHDAFGIDDLAAVAALRDRWPEYTCRSPHLHADAVIAGPAGVQTTISTSTAGFSRRTCARCRTPGPHPAAAPADSLGWIFPQDRLRPYVSACFWRSACRSGAAHRDPAAHALSHQFGRYHPGLFTLECSRSGAVRWRRSPT